MERESILGTNLEESVNILAEALALIDPELPVGTWFDVRDKIEKEYGHFAGEIFYCFADLTEEGLKFTIELANSMLAIKEQCKPA